jgi:hypothetical protein
MLKWLKPLLFVIWGLLLIPVVGAAVEEWVADNIFGGSNAFATAIADQLVVVSEAPWFKFALVYMTGIVVGISLETSAKRAGERRAFELRSLGYKFRSLADALKTRAAAPGWPDNVRDLKPAIMSALTATRKFKLWAPTERVFTLPDASFLCEYFTSVGRLLEDGNLSEAAREALSWKPFLDRANLP